MRSEISVTLFNRRRDRTDLRIEDLSLAIRRGIPMTRRFLTAALFALLFTGSSALAQTSTWAIDTNHTQIDFQIRRVPVSNVRGSFSRITGTVNWDERNPSKSSVQLRSRLVPSQLLTRGAMQILSRPSSSMSRSTRP